MKTRSFSLTRLQTNPPAVFCFPDKFMDIPDLFVPIACAASFRDSNIFINIFPSRDHCSTGLFCAVLIFTRISTDTTRPLFAARSFSRVLADTKCPLCAALIFSRVSADTTRPLCATLIFARVSSDGLPPLPPSCRLYPYGLMVLNKLINSTSFLSSSS